MVTVIGTLTSGSYVSAIVVVTTKGEYVTASIQTHHQAYPRLIAYKPYCGNVCVTL